MRSYNLDLSSVNGGGERKMMNKDFAVLFGPLDRALYLRLQIDVLKIP